MLCLLTSLFCVSLCDTGDFSPPFESGTSPAPGVTLPLLLLNKFVLLGKFIKVWNFKRHCLLHSEDPNKWVSQSVKLPLAKAYSEILEETLVWANLKTSVFCIWAMQPCSLT